MGNCSSSAEQKKNKRIQKELNQAKKASKKQIKILLLGAGESGKTTLYKQMKMLYGKTKTFTPEERRLYKGSIYRNIYHDLSTLLTSFDLESKTFATEEANKAVEEYISMNKKTPILEKEAQVMTILWNDPNLQDHWNNRGTIQIQDSLSYYLDNIERIGHSDWEPTNQDILRVRIRTAGVQSSTLSLDKRSFDVYDVGGQRVERPKWEDYFHIVTSVLFVTACSEYNQVLFEDPSVNRQDESVELFRKTVNNKTFIDIPFILFLNKDDLFREKLGKIPFRIENGENKRNVDFQGPHLDINKEYNYKVRDSDKDFEAGYYAALEYLENLYKTQIDMTNRQKDFQLHVHATTSVDTENVNKIFKSVSTIILTTFLNENWQ